MSYKLVTRTSVADEPNRQRSVFEYAFVSRFYYLSNEILRTVFGSFIFRFVARSSTCFQVF
jgi:hypothetical protein